MCTWTSKDLIRSGGSEQQNLIFPLCFTFIPPLFQQFFKNKVKYKTPRTHNSAETTQKPCLLPRATQTAHPRRMLARTPTSPSACSFKSTRSSRTAFHRASGQMSQTSRYVMWGSALLPPLGFQGGQASFGAYTFLSPPPWFAGHKPQVFWLRIVR